MGQAAQNDSKRNATEARASSLNTYFSRTMIIYAYSFRIPRTNISIASDIFSMALAEKPRPVKDRFALDSTKILAPVNVFLIPIFLILFSGILIDPFIRLKTPLLRKVMNTSSISIMSRE